jgi:hypothetical protein
MSEMTKRRASSPTEPQSSHLEEARAAAKRGRFGAVAHGIYQDDRKLQWVLLAFMVFCYLPLLGISWRLLLWGDPLNLTFNSMFEHLMHGRFDVDPQIVGWEGFVRNGRVYAYWGIFCALLRFPLWIFHRMNVDITLWSCLVAVCITGMAKVRALLLIRRHSVENPAARWAIGLMLGYILLGGSATGYLKPTIYQEVDFWASAFAAIFVYFALQGLIHRSFADKALRWMALCGGLALLTRVTTGIGLILACVLLQLVLAVQESNAARDGHRPAVLRFGQALVGQRFLIPAGIIAVLIAATGTVNYFRWGNPATFSNFYLYICQKCVGDWVPMIQKFGMFNLLRIPFSLMYFFIPVWVFRGSDSHFFLEGTQQRIFHTVELPPSSFFLTDLLPLCFIVLLLIALWRRSRNSPRTMQAAAIAAGLLAPGALIMMLISIAYRYRMEFYPEFDFLALLGLYLTVSNPANLERFARFRRWLAAALAISIVGSLASLVLYNLGTNGGTEREVTGGIVSYYHQAAAEKYHRLLAHYFTTHPR